MENGSRALIMAATVLLGVFLLSMMLYMFRAGGQMTKQFDEKQINLQLENYNRQFEVFDKPNNTITDVISLANLVYSTNEQNEFAEGATVQLDVVIDGITYVEGVLIANKKYGLPSNYNPGVNSTAYNAFLSLQKAQWCFFAIHNQLQIFLFHLVTDCLKFE